MIGLTLKADLENVTDVQFADSLQDPFLFTFTVRYVKSSIAFDYRIYH